MENRGWVTSRWVEKPGERRRCFYRLTAKGRSTLKDQLGRWLEFIDAVGMVTGMSHA